MSLRALLLGSTVAVACTSTAPINSPELTLGPPLTPMTVLVEGAQPSPHSALDITQVDLARYTKTGRFTLEADFFGADGKQAFEPDVASIELRADGVPLATDFSATTYGRAQVPVALAMVVPMHQSYTFRDVESGMDLATTSRVAAGFAAILDGATSGSLANVWTYTELDARRIWNFGSDTRAVANQLRNVEVGHLARLQVAPAFYAALGKAVGDFEEAAPLPARRVLLVVSDGIDRKTSTSLDPVVRALIDRINVQHIETRFVGFTMAMSEPLVPFARVAASTRGHYRFVPFEDYPNLSTHIADIGRAINGRLIIELTPKSPLVVTSALEVIVTLRDGATATGRLVVALTPR